MPSPYHHLLTAICSAYSLHGMSPLALKDIIGGSRCSCCSYNSPPAFSSMPGVNLWSSSPSGTTRRTNRKDTTDKSLAITRNQTSSTMMEPSFGALPTELLLTILGSIQPVYARPPGWTNKVGRNLNRYRSERYSFAQLALVCRQWHAVVQHLLFLHIVIVKPSKSVSLPRALERYSSSIRTIIIDTTFDTSVYGAAFLRTINHCFALATQLEAVELYGPHLLFGSFGSHYIPDHPACPPVRALRWQCDSNSGKNQDQLCGAINYLSSTLERLEVEGCYELTLCDNPHLPPALSQLHRLSLSLGNPKLPHLLGLLDRATFITDCGRKISTLRELELRNVLTLGDTEITAILRHNDMGLRLTTLRLSIWQSFRKQPNIFNFPCTVLALCPSLVQFSYLTSCTPDLFAYLPKTLRTLELCVNAPGASPSPSCPPDELVKYLESPRASNLHTLTLVRRTMSDDRFWEKMFAVVKQKCSEVGVTLFMEKEF